MNDLVFRTNSKTDREKVEITKLNRVVVLNPYLPEYRITFFKEVEIKLRKSGLDFVLVTGNPDSVALERRDMATASFHNVVRSVNLSFRSISIRYLFANKFTRNARAVVYQLSITNLNSWSAVLFKKSHKVILWGHGPGYLSKKFWSRNKIELFMAKRADLIMVYTKPGQDRLIAGGLLPNKVIFLNNTFDWGELKSAMACLTSDELSAYILEHKTQGKKVFAFVGALDESKRVSFLVKVLDVLWESEKDVLFLVAGEGSDRDMLGEAQERGQVKLLGRVGPKEKALLGAVSSGFVNPGNIGLLAIDALVLGKPVFGTDSLSSPEKDFLEEGKTLFTLPNSPELYAKNLLAYQPIGMKVGSSSEIPTVKDFAAKYSESIQEIL
jgi:glycosyltransferase involved in cell wall biosynthesis